MFQKSLIFTVFVAVMMIVSLGNNANAATREKVQQSPCAFMQDIDKRVTLTFNPVFDCVLCRCVLKGVQQDVFRIRYSFIEILDDGDCDDSGDQLRFAFVDATRWVRAESDDLAGKQVFCIRGKEDVFLLLFNDGAGFFGTGVGVVGVGNPLEGELCCNFDENQAVLHLRGFGHNSNGGPAPKKKCWARVKYISLINPFDPTDPCSIESDPNPQFVINGVEGCTCDSSVDVPQGGG